MATVGELLVNLRASTAAFAKDLDKANQLAFGSSKEIERSFKRIGGVITVELTAAVGAITAAVAGAIQEADRMGILAHQAGLTAEQFTALAYAANLSEISAQTLGQTLIFLSKNLEKSNQATNEGKAAHSALSKLFQGNIPIFKDTNDAFLTIVDRLSRLGPGYQQVALASQIFGRTMGAQLVPMLDTKEGMKKLTDEAATLGRVMSEQVVNDANRFDDTVIKLEDSIKGLALQVGVKLMPYLQQLADEFVVVGKSANTSNSTVTAIATAVKVLATVAIATAGAFAVLGAQLAQFVTIAKNIGTAMVGLGTNSAELHQAELNVTDSFLSFVETIQNLWEPAIAAAGVSVDDHKKKTITLKDENLKLAKTYDEIVKKLSEEITAFTLGSGAVVAFKLQAEGATKSQLDFISTLDRMLKNLKEGKDAFTGLSNTPLLDTLQNMNTTGLQLDDTFAKLQAAGFRVWEKSRTSLEKYSIDVANLKILLDKNIIDQETYNRVIEEEGRQLGLVKDKVSKLKPVYDELRSAIAETFIQGILHADSFVSALGRILDKLAEVILETLVLKPLFNWLGSFGGVLGAVFGGALAGGGGAQAGTTYLVGENGPELFTPSVSGTVTPNDRLGGGGATYNIDARGADPTVEFRIRRALAETENRAVVRAVAATRDTSFRTA